jgi:hypothetical protein
MTLPEGVLFKVGKWLSVLVGLCFPHSAYGRPIGTPKTIHLLGVASEMGVQDEPVCGNRLLHNRNLPTNAQPLKRNVRSYVPAGDKANLVRFRTVSALTQTLTLAYR